MAARYLSNPPQLTLRFSPLSVPSVKSWFKFVTLSAKQLDRVVGEWVDSDRLKPHWLRAGHGGSVQMLVLYWKLRAGLYELPS